MQVGGSQEALLLRLLDASGQRSRLLAQNIANQNTPGYRRQVLRFEEQLAEALQRGETDLDEIVPEIDEDFATPLRADGNNVIPELEKNAGEENRLLAESYLSILEFHFRIMRSAIGINR